jgi:glutathione peroxidase-family protein
VLTITVIILAGAVVYTAITGGPAWGGDSDTAKANKKSGACCVSGDKMAGKHTPLMAPDQTSDTESQEAPEKAKVGKLSPDFTLTDAEGGEHTLSDYRDQYIVLEWYNTRCPFVRKYYDSGSMQELQQTYRDKGVVWFTICSSANGKQGYYEGDALTDLIEREESKATAYLIDADGTVGRRYEAKTTPHMFVINPEGVLIYAGAIDDKPSVRQSDLKDATNYVVAALDAAMAGEEIEVKTTKSYGCSVKY